MKRFYLTTPLYYVNAPPHIGHAYTTIVADSLARWHRFLGEEVFFLTGTDEHGQKIAQAAQEAGVSPKMFVDRNSQNFKLLWRKLNISYDHFIRTTGPEHRNVVQQILNKLRPQLKLATYTFWYCVPCETNFGLNEVEQASPVCPQCRRPVQQVQEEDYFLPLEPHRAWLREALHTDPQWIRPSVRRNEVLGMLEEPLPDLCITRPKSRVPWGIEVPFSDDHTTYVWFDALLNYVSALGGPDGKKFQALWEETGAIHFIGKDILRHHAVYWPIILRAVGIHPPRTIFAHGWWLIQGEKMSKSKGNIVDPEVVIGDYGLDPFRYFLLREVPLGEDGIFSEEALIQRINSDLANDLGNLVFRTLTMLEKHAQGRLPKGEPDPSVSGEAVKTQERMAEAMSQFAPSEALKALWELVNRANRLVEERQPWTLARQGRSQELARFLCTMAEMLKATSLLLWPFLPSCAESIWEQLGFKEPIENPATHQPIPLAETLEKPIHLGQSIRKGKPLFPRL